MPKFRFKWIKVSEDEYRCLPDRQHLIVLKWENMLWRWQICLGHERNVLYTGEQKGHLLHEKAAQGKAVLDFLRMMGEVES